MQLLYRYDVFNIIDYSLLEVIVQHIIIYIVG